MDGDTVHQDRGGGWRDQPGGVQGRFRGQTGERERERETEEKDKVE